MFNDLFWALYWIDVLSNVPEYAFVGLMLALASTVPIIGASEGRLWKRAVAAGVVIWFAIMLFVFIPSKQTMYMMLGVKTTDNIVNSETGKKLQQIVNHEIDGYLKKFEKDK